MGKKKVPSPCIDVCKYKRKGHCIGCSMTEKQKSSFKRLEGRSTKLLFLEGLLQQQERLGGYDFWLRAYRKRCQKKGVACPIDELNADPSVSAK